MLSFEKDATSDALKLRVQGPGSHRTSCRARAHRYREECLTYLYKSMAEVALLEQSHTHQKHAAALLLDCEYRVVPKGGWCEANLACIKV